jgi:putative ABC transport system substrate-binding protein
MTTAPVRDLAGPDPAHPAVRALLHGLRALGYVEGRNLVLDRRSAEGRWERLPGILAELLRLEPDVIVSVSNSVTREAQAVTSTVPIVMAASFDPVQAGFVRSLARPGGNITGLTVSVGPEIEAKRLELLHEVVPGVTRVAYLRGSTEADTPWARSVRAAAQALGITLVEAERR